MRRIPCLRLHDFGQFFDQFQQCTLDALRNEGELNTDCLVGMRLPDNALHAQ